MNHLNVCLHDYVTNENIGSVDVATIPAAKDFYVETNEHTYEVRRVLLHGRGRDSNTPYDATFYVMKVNL